MALNPLGEFENPFRPGAGHMPPHLAGREDEIGLFDRLLDQDRILENVVLTGLRGVGKTVLLETFKPVAISKGWLWVGTDLSESVSVSESVLAVRLLTDLSVVSSSIDMPGSNQTGVGFASTGSPIKLTFSVLEDIYMNTPGLVYDKLKRVLETVWGGMAQLDPRGMIFAYDEAQNLNDRKAKDQYPLSLLLDLFQSIQRNGIPFMLVLTGLPTLFPKLVEARTFAERMFTVMTLDRLTDEESREAIEKPIRDERSPVTFLPDSVTTITRESGGYPYFIQFICREVFDVFIQRLRTDDAMEEPISIDAIVRKLDSDFFAGRWAKPTDRQRELLTVIAKLSSADAEFTVQEIVSRSRIESTKSFSASHVNQMLAKLGDMGLIYKNRYGRYSFAVPLFGAFILRQMERAETEALL